MIRQVTEGLRPNLDTRLHQAAIGFILPSGLRVDEAVAVAEDLVASGSTGEATVKVACLSRADLLSDAEPFVRAMLSEHGIKVPVGEDEESKYQFLLRAFGYWDLPIHLFEGPFYSRIPAWDDQHPLDRALVTLLDKRDQMTTPAERGSLEQEMRAVVQAHVAAV